MNRSSELPLLPPDSALDVLASSLSHSLSLLVSLQVFCSVGRRVDRSFPPPNKPDRRQSVRGDGGFHTTAAVWTSGRFKNLCGVSHKLWEFSASVKTKSIGTTQNWTVILFKLAIRLKFVLVLHVYMVLLTWCVCKCLKDQNLNL